MQFSEMFIDIQFKSIHILKSQCFCPSDDNWEILQTVSLHIFNFHTKVKHLSYLQNFMNII